MDQHDRDLRYAFESLEVHANLIQENVQEFTGAFAQHVKSLDAVLSRVKDPEIINEVPALVRDSQASVTTPFREIGVNMRGMLADLEKVRGILKEIRGDDSSEGWAPNN